MGTVVIDTSFAIQLERRLPEAIAAIDGREVVVPAIVLAELLTGSALAVNAHERVLRRERTRALEEQAELVPFGVREADTLAELRAYCLANGVKRGQYDLMVAAHSIAERATLLTTDRRAKFEELPGVLVQYV